MLKTLIITIAIFIVFETANRIVYTNLVGIVGVKRRNKKIYTTFSIIALIRYLREGKEEFFKDCEKFFNNLDENVLYTTETHSLFLKEIKKRCSYIEYEKTRKKRMILAKLLIGNTNKLFRKTQHFHIKFKK